MQPLNPKNEQKKAQVEPLQPQQKKKPVVNQVYTILISKKQSFVSI